MATSKQQFFRWLGMPMVLGAMAVGACSQPGDVTTETETTNGGYEEEVAKKPETLEAAAERPEDFLGETLTVVGEVVEVYGSQAFVIQEEVYFGEEEELLVIAESTDMAIPEVGDTVELTGRMERLAVADLNKDYDIVLDQAVLDELEVTYAEAPFILAKSIQQ